MKLSSIGFGFCALGCFLYAVNFFAAAFEVPHLTEWPVARGKIGGGFDAVGHQPGIIGAGLFAAGVVILITALAKKKDANGA